MQHQTHIAAVHPHPEGNGGHQHRPFLLKETGQCGLARLRIETGVIRRGIDFLLLQPLRPVLHGTTGTRINQRSPPRRSQGFEHLRHRIPGPALHHVVKVVPAGGTHLHQGTAQGQKPDDVGTHPGSGSGAEGQHGDPRAEATDESEPAVVRAEVMAPGADAMGFVHGQGNQPSRVGMAFQHALGGFPLKPLRSDIEQSQGFIPQMGKGLLTPQGIEAGVQTGRCDSPALQLQHLIFHQSHQW